MKQVQSLAISKLKPFTGNPRRGVVKVIQESLEEFGQYSPVIVRETDTGYEILANHHVVQAAKANGLKKVDAVVIDAADEQHAKRIVVADNRTADVARYDQTRQNEVLARLSNAGQLKGTGYDEKWLHILEKRQAANDLFSEKIDQRLNEASKTQARDVEVAIAFGPMWRFVMAEVEIGAAWLADMFPDGSSADGASERLAALLDLPIVQGDAKVAKSTGTNHGERILAGEIVDIDDVVHHPENFRQGDVDLIADSLNINGQFRPIVVQRSTGHILKGNHTTKAAKKLGWKSIGVHFIDCDDETALRILVADNGTSDHASYDSEALADRLLELDDHQGTGFSQEQYDFLLHDLGRRKGDFRPLPTFRLVYKDWNFSLKVSSHEAFDTWVEELTREGRYSPAGMFDVLMTRLSIDYPIQNVIQDDEEE